MEYYGESEVVRKVAKYLDDNFYNEDNIMSFQKHAVEIIKLVHEAEDSDE